MRNVLAIIALAATSCAVALPVRGENALREEIEASEQIRAMLPETVPPGYTLFGYGTTYNADDELVALDSQYANDGSIVSLCVSTEQGPGVDNMGCADGPSQRVDRESMSFMVATACSSDECETNLDGWLQVFGTTTPTADQATALLGPDP